MLQTADKKKIISRYYEEFQKQFKLNIIDIIPKAINKSAMEIAYTDNEELVNCIKKNIPVTFYYNKKLFKCSERYIKAILFNYFHDELKEVIEDKHWAEKFREISGISKEETDACYWYNKEIKNNEEANKKLIDYILSGGIKGLTSKQTRKNFESLGNRQYQPRALKELFGV